VQCAAAITGLREKTEVNTKDMSQIWQLAISSGAAMSGLSGGLIPLGNRNAAALTSARQAAASPKSESEDWDLESPDASLKGASSPRAKSAHAEKGLSSSSSKRKSKKDVPLDTSASFEPDLGNDDYLFATTAGLLNTAPVSRPDEADYASDDSFGFAKKTSSYRPSAAASQRSAQPAVPAAAVYNPVSSFAAGTRPTAVTTTSAALDAPRSADDSFDDDLLRSTDSAAPAEQPGWRLDR
jgi:hypothetical protein